MSKLKKSFSDLKQVCGINLFNGYSKLKASMDSNIEKLEIVVKNLEEDLNLTVGFEREEKNFSTYMDEIASRLDGCNIMLNLEQATEVYNYYEQCNDLHARFAASLTVGREDHYVWNNDANRISAANVGRMEKAREQIILSLDRDSVHAFTNMLNNTGIDKKISNTSYGSVGHPDLDTIKKINANRLEV